MVVGQLYTVEAGSFILKDGKPIFREPDLKIPLVMGVDIGRSSDFAEDGYCHGFDLFSGADYMERANYNGEKIIIPNHTYPFRGSTRIISRNHGRLERNEKSEFDYIHKSKKMSTILWGEKEGLIGDVHEIDSILNLPFSEDKSQLYLLLGGKHMESLEEKFKFPSYYVSIIDVMKKNGKRPNIRK